MSRNVLLTKIRTVFRGSLMAYPCGTGIAPHSVMGGTAIILATAAKLSCAFAIPAAGKARRPL
jgi:hypothetical protein